MDEILILSCLLHVVCTSLSDLLGLLLSLIGSLFCDRDYYYYFFRGESTSDSLAVQYNNQVKMSLEHNVKNKLNRSDSGSKSKASTSANSNRGTTKSWISCLCFTSR